MQNNWWRRDLWALTSFQYALLYQIQICELGVNIGSMWFGALKLGWQLVGYLLVMLQCPSQDNDVTATLIWKLYYHVADNVLAFPQHLWLKQSLGWMLSCTMMSFVPEVTPCCWVMLIPLPFPNRFSLSKVGDLTSLSGLLSNFKSKVIKVWL